MDVQALEHAERAAVGRDGVFQGRGRRGLLDSLSCLALRQHQDDADASVRDDGVLATFPLDASLEPPPADPGLFGFVRRLGIVAEQAHERSACVVLPAPTGDLPAFIGGVHLEHVADADPESVEQIVGLQE